MHSTARYFIKTAFLFFALGLFTGLYMYGAKVFGWVIPVTLVSAHTHVILMGGMLLMILGVATWFFPRPPKDDTRYNPRAVLLFYWSFTLSTLTRFIVEVWMGVSGDFAMLPLGFFVAGVQVLSTIGLIFLLWSRIRPVGSQLREAKGEKF
ncbi:MAG: hypothetical protein IIA59_12265 [Candidatus Marinimicrobia bacterium]|nr:hypothetical protein [Candidatus Neomarinimicrobiota bacterium]